MAATRLRWESAAYGTAILTDRLAGFLLLPVLTQSWPQQDYGAWSQVLAISGLLSNVLQLGFYHAIVKYVAAAPRPQVGRTLHGMLLAILVNCALMTMASVAFDQSAGELLFGTDQYRLLVLPAAIYIAAECLFEFVVLGFLRADGRILTSSMHYVVKTVGRLGLTWYLVAAGHGLEAVFLALAAMQGVLTALVYAMHVVPTTPVAVRGLGRAYWYAVLRYSLPIVLSTNIAWLNVFLNRFVITHYLGIDQLAHFAANYSIASIMHVAAMIVTFTMIPRINAAWNSADKSGAKRLVASAVELYLVLAVLGGLAIGLLYPYLAQILIPPDYHGSAALIVALLASMLLLGLDQILMLATLLQDSRFALRARLVCLALNVALNALIVVWPDVLVTVLASCAAIGTGAALNLWRLRAILGYAPAPRLPVDLILAGGAMTGAGSAALRWLEIGSIVPALFVVAAAAVPYVAINCVRPGSPGRVLAAALLRALRGHTS